MSEPIKPIDRVAPLTNSQVGYEQLEERIETAVMLTKNGRPRSLRERMVDYTIPGVSMAVINDCRLEWACGYGVRKRGEPGRIETETLFQARSISKTVTAIAVLRLAEEGASTWTLILTCSWQATFTGFWQG